MEKIRAQKPTQVQQALSIYRKKHKLDIPALTTEQIALWGEGKEQ